MKKLFSILVRKQTKSNLPANSFLRSLPGLHGITLHGLGIGRSKWNGHHLCAIGFFVLEMNMNGALKRRI
jgi:hypothetical protein